MTRSIAAVCVLFLVALLAHPILAADPAPSSKPAPATTQSSTVSPDAAAVLAKVGDAYSKLKSIQQTGNLNGNFDVDGQKNDEKAEFTYSYAAPNQFRHEVKGEALIGSTGEKFYIYTKDKNLYMMADAPKGKVMSDDLPDPFAQVVGAQNVSLALALSKDPAAELTKSYGKISKVDDVKVDDKAYTALSMTNEKGPSATLLIDPSTSLVRRAIVDLSADIIAHGAPNVKKALVTVDYATTTPNATTQPDQFAWAPPAGAKDANEAPAGGGEEDEASKALTGKPAPDFKLKGLDDKEVTLADLKGSVVVLDFWATWCGPCVASLPKLDKMYQDKKGDGVKVFAVNQGEEKAAAEAFVKAKSLSVPVLLDSDSKVGELYKAHAIPETVVIGKDGIVKKVFVGAGPDTAKQLVAAVEAANKASK
jgi:peroxiredoxin/outer membrane lipoprotein-sorting protein